jgi:DNA-binding LacI/PurR family transcriptional regulator
MRGVRKPILGEQTNRRELLDLAMHLGGDVHNVKQPASMRVYQLLHYQICSGELPFGMRLPPEPELAKQYGVARPALRVSLARLESEGFIVRRSRAGTHVCFQASQHDRAKSKKTILYISSLRPEQVHGNWHLPVRALSGIQRAVNDFGLALCWTSGAMIDDLVLLDQLVERKSLLGIIWHASHVRDTFRILTRLKRSNAPLVLLQGTKDDERYVPHVVRDDFGKSFHALTQHLIQLGHRDIAFVDVGKHPERSDGYCLAMNEAGLESSVLNFTGEGLLSVEAIHGAMDVHFRHRDLPTAFVAMADFCAFGVLSFLRQRGVKVPAKVSVVGYGDRPESAFMQPPLTTMNSRLADAGYEAVRLLTNLQRSPQKRGADHLVLESQLILRGSSARAPTGSVLAGAA